MPMPQRNSRRVVQLLSNNSLLSGPGATGISTASATGLSNCIRTGSNNNNHIGITNNTATLPANGRVLGTPVAAAAAAAASTPPALNNTIATSAHHHQPPPLITDTLTACLDVHGTYICTSYSPRCYIIQKVTPNTVTVTPHLLGTESANPGNSPAPGVGPPLIPGRPPGASPIPSSSRKFSKSGGRGGVISCTSPPQHTQFGSQIPHAPRPHPHRQFPLHPPHLHSPSHPHNTPQRYGHSSYPGRSSGKNMTYTDNSISSIPPSTNVSAVYPPPGLAYMNGEAGPATAAFTGEESTPAMVLQSSSSTSSGIQISENRVVNGLKDGIGMSREQMKSVESNDIESADNSRRNEPGSGANQTSSDISKEDLKRLLLQQLEYYFSPENLASDKFLVSQMDSDHYVSISTLANFNMVKKLTGDIDLVTEVLRDSKNVQVHSDGKRVRPASHRTVVILRGIPESTPVEEIKGLFNSENCPKCNSCEFAFNDSWYVSFESDEDAQRAHRYLREDVKEFKGQPIMARIKSRPTTLLAQGAGVHLKNGFHQPGQVMGPFIPPSYVSGSQTGPTTAVAPSPLYTHGQSVPPVFPLPPNYSYGAWPGFFGMAPEQISQMYPQLPQQHQPSSSYPKSLPMNPRPRNPNQVRPRRLPASSSDNQGMNGVAAVSGGGSNVTAHQSYGNPPRKNTAPPPPLLNIVPTPSLPLVNPATQNHSQGHLPHSTVQVGGNAISQNGSRHYVNSIPSSHSLDYHPSGSMRPYRGGGMSDSRPRSSLSNRKGPPRREEETNYDRDGHGHGHGPTASPSISAKVPSTRGAPPNAPVPQPLVETPGPPATQGNINLDLEGSQFPPLPGSGQASGKNGDSVFEGRLSDVVKGVKNIKTGNSSDKDDVRPVNTSTEIIVSAEEDNFSDVREVSAASPVKDLEADKKPEHSSSQSVAPRGKRFRDVGVGSADDTHDIRSSHFNTRSSVTSVRSKETADKSTRIDDALLNGDQSQGIKPGSSSTSAFTQASSFQNGGSRKSAPQSKSPAPGKRAVPVLHGQNVSSTSVQCGPEVPYSSRNVTSPITSSAKFTTPHSSGGSGNTSSIGNAVLGRGANAYMAKQSTDNNNTRANGMVSNNSGSNLDREAFPSPGFVKSVPSCKPFPTSHDQVSKEIPRNDADKERKESGQGDGKKSDDCSTDEREGPVRLSYAQVAQQRKETAAGGSNSNSQSSSSTSSVTNCASSASNSSSSATQCSLPTSADEKKRRENARDSNNTRSLPKSQRGGDRGDRNFRRGFRNRVMSDQSDGGSVTSGESTRRLSKPSRSPK